MKPRVVLIDAPPAVLRVELRDDFVRVTVFQDDGSRSAEITGKQAEELADALCPPDATA